MHAHEHLVDPTRVSDSVLIICTTSLPGSRMVRWLVGVADDERGARWRGDGVPAGAPLPPAPPPATHSWRAPHTRHTATPDGFMISLNLNENDSWPPPCFRDLVGQFSAWVTQN